MGSKIPESVLVVVYTPALSVLVLRRTDCPDFWQSVTGSKAHHDEPLLETCRREVWEETGLDVHAPGTTLQDWQQSHCYAIFPHWRHRYPAGVTHNTEHVFGLCVAAEHPVRLAAQEHLEYRWLPWQAAAACCGSPSNAAAIQTLPQRVGLPAGAARR